MFTTQIIKREGNRFFYFSLWHVNRKVAAVRLRIVDNQN